MFATVRAKLIGFCFLSLLFIVLVSVAGYFNQSGPDPIERIRDNNDSLKASMLVEKAHANVRADLLQILRLAKNGDIEGVKEAAKDL